MTYNTKVQAAKICEGEGRRTNALIDSCLTINLLQHMPHLKTNATWG